MSVRAILDWLWAILGLYWVVTALRTKRSATQEKSWYRLLRLGLLAAMLLLLLTKALRVGPLAWRFVPHSLGLVWVGVVLTAVGVALAICARWHLGQNWSDKVVLKVDHELIRSGPYAYLRHPIYSGVLLAVAGTALVIGEWRGVVAFALISTNYCLKAIKEERMLVVKFGGEFLEHKRRTGFFLPGI